MARNQEVEVPVKVTVTPVVNSKGFSEACGTAIRALSELTEALKKIDEEINKKEDI
jgi:hypothetical protein